jgi:serine/threonine protein kinase
MRVLFVIPKSDAPRLPQDGSFSVEFQDFVAKCLQKTAKDRPSAKELLQHDFLKRVDPEAIADAQGSRR